MNLINESENHSNKVGREVRIKSAKMSELFDLTM